jgi:hypothetical protein
MVKSNRSICPPSGAHSIAAGRTVEAKAERGESVLKKVLEVALVPLSSPISKSGL